MDQSFFANVKIACTGAATPVVRLAFRNAVLKLIKPGVVFVAHLLDLLENVLFLG